MTSTITDQMSGASSAGATVDQLTAARTSAAVKAPCQAVALANVALTGEQTINGVTTNGTRILLTAQTDAKQNGIWITSTGDWVRAPDWDDSSDVVEGTRIWVTDGTVGGLAEYVVTTNNPIVVGTTSVVIVTAEAAIGVATLASPAFTGVPTAPTAAPGTNTAQLSTTAFVTAAGAVITAAYTAAIAAVLGGVAAGFDTLAEIATDLARKAYLDVEEQVITGGARVTSKDLGTITTGTTTLDPGDRPLQHCINGGAFTLAPGANGGSILLDITNNGSAGAITVSGWTKVVGAFTTTNAHKFRCHGSIGNAGSLLTIQPLQ